MSVLGGRGGGGGGGGGQETITMRLAITEFTRKSAKISPQNFTKMISCESPSQEEQNGPSFSFIAPSSKE